jgi:hypothetical protein
MAPAKEVFSNSYAKITIKTHAATKKVIIFLVFNEVYISSNALNEEISVAYHKAVKENPGCYTVADGTNVKGCSPLCFGIIGDLKKYEPMVRANLKAVSIVINPGPITTIFKKLTSIHPMIVPHSINSDVAGSISYFKTFN